MINGFGSPYYKLFYNGERLEHKFTRLRYVHAEEEDDTMEVYIEDHDVSVMDGPEFTEKAKWTVVIGYMNEPGTFTEVCYLEDVVADFDKDGIKITLKFHDKLATVKKVRSNASTTWASVPTAAAKVADKHNMNLQIDNPADGGHKGGTWTVKDWSKLKFSTVHIGASERDPIQELKKKQEARTQAGMQKLQGFKIEPLKVDMKGHRAGSDNARAPLQGTAAQAAQGRSYYVSTPAVYTQGTATSAHGQALVKPKSKQLISWGPAGGPNFKDKEVQKAALKDPQVMRLVDNGSINNPEQLGNFLQNRYNYLVYGTLPHGNKSQAAVINNKGKNESGGRQRVVGHGDTLHVVKRNFNQAPIATYKYKDDFSGFTDFKPETKNKSKEAGATAVTYTGWDKKKKKPYSGVATGETNATKQDATLGGGVVPKYKPSGDNTYGTLQQYMDAPQAPAETQEEQIARRQATLESGASEDPNNVSQHYNLTGMETPDEANNFASNRQAENNESLNPATLNVPGNVELKSGKIVSILGVGQRFSGNYYITKVVHELSQSVAYTCSLELVRNTSGKTSKLSSTRDFLKGSDKTVNTKVSDRSPYNNTRKATKSRAD